MSDIELDDYTRVFFEGQARGTAPVTGTSSDASINVPFPVLPGHLQGPPLMVAAPRTARTAKISTRSLLTTGAPAVARPPLMFTTGVPTAKPSRFPAAQAAGGSLPSPSPAMGASSPTPPDGTVLPPLPEPPSSPSAAFPSSINTNMPGASVSCPPCSCPGGISTGSILALLAAAGYAGYLITQRGK